MQIKKVCVIGMGTMGSQIGIACAKGGYETAMVDASPEFVESGLDRIRSFLKSQQKKEKMDQETSDRILSRINAGTDLNKAMSRADIAIEAVYEEIVIKQNIFKKMDDISPKNTILASNTSTLWITEIAAATARPDRCIGTHFLIPAALTPLVEVVRGTETSDETHETVINFLNKCDKETVTVADSPGFVINRLYLPMINEAFFALETGLASAEEIDKSCSKGLGFPLGPLALIYSSPA